MPRHCIRYAAHSAGAIPCAQHHVDRTIDDSVGYPFAAPIIASLLKGDVVSTNLEAAIIDERKGQSRKDGRFLSPPGELEALKTFGFNLLSRYARPLAEYNSGC